ncbi:MAG: energy transducer TonB [Bacteroidales bacterium]|nr:energy transducer TonB [Bacteroidales bacterium]
MLNLTSPLFPALDEQALRIVNEMPRWNPAAKNGRPVDCRCRLILYYGLF